MDLSFNQHIKYLLVLSFKDARPSSSVQTFLSLKDCEDTIDYNKDVLFSANVYQFTGYKKDFVFGCNINPYDSDGSDSIF